MSWMTDWEKDVDTREERLQEVALCTTPSGHSRHVWRRAEDERLLICPGVNGAVPDDVAAQVREVTAKVGRFRTALKEQKIHVGIGTPPVCATCDTPWPCEEAR